MGLALGLELFGKSHFVPDIPRFSKPNSIDGYMRDKLWAGADKQDNARIWSDRLLYGVSMSSLVWGPVLAEDSNLSFLINARVFAANNIITNIVKITTARERPYHYYGTRVSEESRDFTSFYSGHSSVAFSQVVANAMILSRSYPNYKSTIWSTLMGAAALTAYLRVAGDMHYLSDILTGAIMGSIVAWSITNTELNRFENLDDGANTLLKYQGSGSNFMVSLKIPLG
ncbi:MAG: phosphatase PAP2 family protein [Candidatus Marinimicrobia bacterium]|jgi:hypothetical protein|nr:phosphatase PAP2 family protein [Candidatus Neomarinimicrobiota bacterium]MBT3825057.1 phosphatase PAP2 family protein [Candidatus Neomarinimicrobiota bacterium]MBT4421506.1 phosphatase PAP2 family protein [Candidatus Neomarinimicrobiota bacterium]MBT7579610.1 phosphatase PAP2 family protein [Candidatus Neomarinimicrobiota bacterium]